MFGFNSCGVGCVKVVCCAVAPVGGGIGAGIAGLGIVVGIFCAEI